MSIVRVAVVCLGLLLASVVRAEIKVYDVDFKYQREVYEALNEILVRDPAFAGPGTAFGRVELLPTGQIVVDTAPATQAQIEQLLAAVAARQTDVSPSARLRYWAVLGSPAAEAAGDTPSMLSDVLAELERVHGDLTFRVLGTATLVTESGQEGEVEGRPLTVRQRAYVQGDTASAEIAMRLTIRERFEPELDNAGNVNVFATTRVEETAQELNLNVTLNRGEFLVLGENTIQTPGGIDGTLFYIVNWPAAE
ncbi:MAG TPA: hypothetical protein VF329_11480 [Gammaproteobacteria bacterium]